MSEQPHKKPRKKMLRCTQCGKKTQAYSARSSDGRIGLCHACVPFGLFMEMVR